MDDISDTRREFVKKSAYIAPAILTLAAAPAFAKSGSDKGKKPDDDGGGKGKDKGDDKGKKPPKTQGAGD